MISKKKCGIETGFKTFPFQIQTCRHCVSVLDEAASQAAEELRARFAKEQSARLSAAEEVAMLQRTLRKHQEVLGKIKPFKALDMFRRTVNFIVTLRTMTGRNIEPGVGSAQQLALMDMPAQELARRRSAIEVGIEAAQS